MFIILSFDRPIQRATATTDRGHKAPAVDMLCMCLIWLPDFSAPKRIAMVHPAWARPPVSCTEFEARYSSLHLDYSLARCFAL